MHRKMESSYQYESGERTEKNDQNKTKQNSI